MDRLSLAIGQVEELAVCARGDEPVDSLGCEPQHMSAEPREVDSPPRVKRGEQCDEELQEPSVLGRLARLSSAVKVYRLLDSGTIGVQAARRGR